MKIRKSHKWDHVPAVFARCPHCGWWNTYEWVERNGDIIRWCKECGKKFELGKQN